MSNATGELPRHELLLKLLKMTASTNDAEALVALRKANQLLATAGWDWDKLLSGKITVVGDPFGNLQRPAAHEPNPYAQPRTPPGRPAATQAQCPPHTTAPKYTYTPRAKRARPAVNYDDIFSDAQAFGRTS